MENSGKVAGWLKGYNFSQTEMLEKSVFSFISLFWTSVNTFHLSAFRLYFPPLKRLINLYKHYC